MGFTMDMVLYRKQREILEFIGDFRSKNGCSPTLREIASGVGVSSPATIAEHLQALEKKGVITKQSGRRRSISIAPEFERTPDRKIPVIGIIAAGQPLEAIEDKNTHIDFVVSDPGSCYALKVKGESMIEDGILENDYVVVKKQMTATDGDLVVALLDDGSATLKRFYRENNRIRLQPANSEMNPIYVRDVTIQGRVVGLMRRFDGR
jgi:repressor LexA